MKADNVKRIIDNEVYSKSSYLDAFLKGNSVKQFTKYYAFEILIQLIKINNAGKDEAYFSSVNNTVLKCIKEIDDNGCLPADHTSDLLRYAGLMSYESRSDLSERFLKILCDK